MPRVGRLAGACVGMVAALALAAAPAGAVQLPGVVGPPPISAPKFGDFRAVLAQGEGQTVNAADLASYEALATPPATFTNQTPLYAGIMPHASTLTSADLNVFYRNTDFSSMPGGNGSVETPRPGVEIFRDKKYGMAHVYGATRSGLLVIRWTGGRGWLKLVCPACGASLGLPGLPSQPVRSAEGVPILKRDLFISKVRSPATRLSSVCCASRPTAAKSGA